jgi:hypothetical protein
VHKTSRSCPIESTQRPRPESAIAPISDETDSVGAGLEAELIELERLSLDDLRLRWRNNWGRLAPARLSRGLLFRVMAYRLQAEAFGDLDRKTVGLLERMTNGAVEKLTANGSGTPRSDERGESKISSARVAHEPLILKPGALLIREWQGRLERVTVFDDGFAWNGTTYASLSAAALAITGTKWNGHRFFGLRRRDNVRVGERKDAAKRIDGRERPSVLPRRKPINLSRSAIDRRHR